MAAWIARLAVRYPKPLLLLVLAVSLVAALGTPRLSSVSYLERSLAQDDPELLRYQALQDEFGSDRLAILVVGCGEQRPCETAFEPEVLETVRALDEAALRHPGIESVESLTSAGILSGDDGTLRAVRLGEPIDAEAIARFRRLVLNDPLVPGTLVSEDLRATAVIVRFDPDLSDQQRNVTARKLLAEAAEIAGRSDFTLYVSGDVSFTALTDGYVRSDLAYLTPIMVLLLGAFLLWILRDAVSVLLALATVSIPALWVFGLMGWLDRPISPITSVLPILIMVVGVTDSIHLLVRVYDLHLSRDTLREVVNMVAEEVGPPTSITALTAALGFLALLTGKIPAIRDFGLFAAIGIGLGWVLTFSLIPAVLVGLRVTIRPVAPPSFALGDQLLEQIRGLAHGRANVVLAIVAVTTVLAGFGISRLVPENDSLKIIGQQDILFRSNEFIESQLRPTASIEISYHAAEGEDVLEPSTLERLAEVETLLRDEGGGAPVISLLPILRVANRAIAGPLELPDSREAAVQLLLLADFADAESVRRVVSSDHRVARLSGAYAVEPGGKIRSDVDRIRGDLASIFGNEDSWAVTGSIFLAAHIGNLVLSTQISSFSAAFLTILFVIFVYIRSVGLGALGMIPNLFPVLVILGVMGWLEINLDVATAMIASIVLGISVDDTIYFLTHYKKARSRGADVRDSVAYTFAVAGKPALFASGVLALGFFTLGFSRFQSLAVFGLLSGFAVLLAAVAELFIMPALLEIFRARKLA